jgi:hypothetical protein
VAGVSASLAASSENAGVAGAAAGPIPAGANAGQHSPVNESGLAVWGAVLMILGGAAGLFLGVRPQRGRAH